MTAPFSQLGLALAALVFPLVVVTPRLAALARSLAAAAVDAPSAAFPPFDVNRRQDMAYFREDDPVGKQFRNGRPVRMSSWVQVKYGRFARRLNRFLRLQGEVVTIHFDEEVVPEEEFDLAGATVDCSVRDTGRWLRILTTQRTYTLTFGSSEEMHIWAHAFEFAVQHRFEDCYLLDNLIAEGTFSQIYTCHPVDAPDETYVVKRVKKRRHDEQALDWLQRERHINGLLDHQNVVQAVDMFSTADKDYLVFEYMAGGTLADLLKRRKKLPESYARVVMIQLCKALQYIHSKYVVHRDVQPANIFCSAPKFPMSIALGDFGLSNFVQDNRVNLDVLSSLVGTPPYISVDVVRKTKYGPSSDLWSVGVVLYEMLSGELPFTGRSDREKVEKIKAGVVKFDSPAWDNISNDAKGLVRQLLNVDPYKRISALGALNHAWVRRHAEYSLPVSSTGSLPTTLRPYSPPPSTSLGCVDTDLSVNKSVDGLRRSSGNPRMATSMSGFSRVPSSSTSSASRDMSTDRVEWGERPASSMGLFGGGPPPLMHHASSLSSGSGVTSAQQPRLQMTPSVRAITQKGLSRVHSDNPGRIAKLMSSNVMQKQLSLVFPYRRKLVVVARAFVAVFRLKALKHGHSATRHLSRLGQACIDDVDAMISKRKRALDELRSSRDTMSADLPHVIVAKPTAHPA